MSNFFETSQMLTLVFGCGEGRRTGINLEKLTLQQGWMSENYMKLSKK